MNVDWPSLAAHLGFPLGGPFGVREVIVGLVSLLLVYVVGVSLRLVFMKRRKKRDAAEASRPEGAVGPGLARPGASAYQEMAATPASGGEEEPSLPRVESSGERESGDPQFSPQLAHEPQWHEPPAVFAEEQLVRALEAQVDALRDEVDTLRGEVSLLREELQARVAQMHSAQQVSPLYSDAMLLAQAGHGADAVAERCGISRAEAELVVSLAKHRGDEPGGGL